MNLEKIENGYMIEGKIFLSGGQIKDGMINLGLDLGADMNYGKTSNIMIDFPGEYDIDGYFIKSYLGDENKLNYIIRLEGEKIAIIQTPSIIEKEEINGIQQWLYTDPYTEKVLERTELEGQKTLLEF